MSALAELAALLTTPNTAAGDDPYAGEAAEFPWSSLFEFGPTYTPPEHMPTKSDIASVECWWYVSGRDYADEDVNLLGRLTDGRWVTCVAWSDSSGFGCQEQVDWRIHETRRGAVTLGLDQAARRNLGLALPGEAL